MENGDSCFSKSYKIRCEDVVSPSDVYILHVAAQFRNSQAKVVAGLSDFRFVMYDINDDLRCTFSTEAHNDVITGVKYFSDSEDLFFTSSLDGSIKLWDTRTKPKPSLVFTDDTDGETKLKAISCFDISCDNKFICGGTPLIEMDCYLLFWDIRRSSVLGGYWESHTNDVTQVKFGRRQARLLLSSSTDGLVNIFDVNQPDEDNALQGSLNVNTAIQKLELLDTTVSCVTDMETVEFWNIDGIRPLKSFDRKALASAMDLAPNYAYYVTDIHSVRDAESIILGGESINLKSVILSGGELRQFAGFEENKQIVRCSCYDSVNDVFITAGEGGIINVWTC